MRPFPPLAGIVLATAFPAMAQGSLTASATRLVPGQLAVFTLTPGPGQAGVEAWEWRVAAGEADAGWTGAGGFSRLRKGLRNIYRAPEVDRERRLRVQVRPANAEEEEAWTALEIRIEPPALRIQGPLGADLRGVPSGGRVALEARVPQGGHGPLDWSVEELQGGVFQGPRHGNHVLWQAPEVVEPLLVHIWAVNPANGLRGCEAIRVVPRKEALPGKALQAVLRANLLSRVLGHEWNGPALERRAVIPEKIHVGESAWTPREVPGWMVLSGFQVPGLWELPRSGDLRPMHLRGSIPDGPHAIPEQDLDARLYCRALSPRLPNGHYAAALVDYGDSPFTGMAFGSYLCDLGPDGRLTRLAGRPREGWHQEPVAEGPSTASDLPELIEQIVVGPTGAIYLLARDGPGGSGSLARVEGGQVRPIADPVRVALQRAHIEVARSVPRRMAVDAQSGDLYVLGRTSLGAALACVDLRGNTRLLLPPPHEDNMAPPPLPVDGPAWHRPTAAPMVRDMTFHQGWLWFLDSTRGGLWAFDPKAGLERLILPEASGPRWGLPLPGVAPELLPEETACLGEARRLMPLDSGLGLCDGKNLLGFPSPLPEPEDATPLPVGGVPVLCSAPDLSVEPGSTCTVTVALPPDEQRRWTWEVSDPALGKLVPSQPIRLDTRRFQAEATAAGRTVTLSVHDADRPWDNGSVTLHLGGGAAASSNGSAAILEDPRGVPLRPGGSCTLSIAAPGSEAWSWGLENPSLGRLDLKDPARATFTATSGAAGRRVRVWAFPPSAPWRFATTTLAVAGPSSPEPPSLTLLCAPASRLVPAGEIAALRVMHRDGDPAADWAWAVDPPTAADLQDLGHGGARVQTTRTPPGTRITVKAWLRRKPWIRVSTILTVVPAEGPGNLESKDLPPQPANR